jgi:hypothetical protein
VYYRWLFFDYFILHQCQATVGGHVMPTGA